MACMRDAFVLESLNNVLLYCASNPNENHEGDEECKAHENHEGDEECTAHESHEGHEGHHAHGILEVFYNEGHDHRDLLQ